MDAINLLLLAALGALLIFLGFMQLAWSFTARPALVVMQQTGGDEPGIGCAAAFLLMLIAAIVVAWALGWF